MSREFKTGISAPSVSLDNLNLSVAERLMVWNSDEGTVDLGLDGALPLHVGQEVLYRVTNNTGSALSKGAVVKAAGTTGASGKILASLFTADGTDPSEYVLGLVADDIDNDSDGYVVHFGKVRGLNTTAFAEGDILYASPTIAGGLTATKPTAPNNIVTTAIVLTDHATVGELFVRPTLASNLDSDESVVLTSPADKNVLGYVNADGVWKNQTLTQVSPVTTKGDLLVRDSSALARLGVGSDGTVLTADSGETAGVKWAAGGKVLQVVSTTKTDTYSASVAREGISGNVTGLTASITPSSTSSKVLVMVMIGVSTSSITDPAGVVLYRDNALLTGAVGDTDGTRSRVTGAAGEVDRRSPATVHLSYLDAPSTTSATTYSVRLRHGVDGTATVYVNRSTDSNDDGEYFRSASSITLMEVAS